MSDSPEWITELLQRSQLPEGPKTIDAIHKTFEEAVTQRLAMKIFDMQQENVKMKNMLEGLEKKVQNQEGKIQKLEDKMSRVRRRVLRGRKAAFLAFREAAKARWFCENAR